MVDSITTPELTQQVDIKHREGKQIVEHNPLDALRLYDEAIAIAGNDPGLTAWIRFDKGKTLLSLGQFQDALTEFRHSQESLGDNTYVHTEIGNAQVGMKKLSAAETEYNHALAVNPDNWEAAQGLERIAHLRQQAEALHVQGVQLLAQGNNEAALHAYEQAIALIGEENIPWSVFDLGKTLESMGRHDQAIVQLTRSKELLPGVIWPDVELAHVYITQKKLIQAQQILDQLKRQHPEVTAIDDGLSRIHAMLSEAEDLHKQGVTLRDQNNYAEALKMYRLAIDKVGMDNAPWTVFDLGVTLHTLGNINDSIAYLEQADALIPNNVWVTLELARVYNAANQTEEAISQYEKAISLDPNNTQILSEMKQAMAQRPIVLSQIASMPSPDLIKQRKEHKKRPRMRLFALIPHLRVRRQRHITQNNPVSGPVSVQSDQTNNREVPIQINETTDDYTYTIEHGLPHSRDWYTFLILGDFLDLSGGLDKSLHEVIERGTKTYADIQEDYIRNPKFIQSIIEDFHRTPETALNRMYRSVFPYKPNIINPAIRAVQIMYDVMGVHDTINQHAIQKLHSNEDIIELYHKLLSSKEHTQLVTHSNVVFHLYEEIVGHKPDFDTYDYYASLSRRGISHTKLRELLTEEKELQTNSAKYTEYRNAINDVTAVYQECFGLITIPSALIIHDARTYFNGEQTLANLKEILHRSPNKLYYLTSNLSNEPGSAERLGELDKKAMYESLLGLPFDDTVDETYKKLPPIDALTYILSSPLYKKRKRISNQVCQEIRKQYYRTPRLAEINEYTHLALVKGISEDKIHLLITSHHQ